MDKLGAFGTYQKSLSETYANSQKKRTGAANREDKTERTRKTGATMPVQLSDRAKALLEELKKKYTNMDFMVADYETDEEAQSYLSRGTKEYSVLIDPDTLEEMASSEEAKSKYLGLIDEATSNLSGLKEKLEEEGDTDVKRLGVSIGKDGSVSYFAELERSSEKQRERIEQSREKKAEEKKAKEKEEAAQRRGDVSGTGKYRSDSPTKTVRVSASSTKELYEKIKQVDWNRVFLGGEATGKKVDFTV